MPIRVGGGLLWAGGVVQVLMEMTTLGSALVAPASKLPADHLHVFI